jgi:hypothetical protein
MTLKEVYTEEFYAVEEVAGRLRVRPFTKVGQVEGLPLGRRVRFEQEDINALIGESCIGPIPEERAFKKLTSNRSNRDLDALKRKWKVVPRLRRHMLGCGGTSEGDNKWLLDNACTVMVL